MHYKLNVIWYECACTEVHQTSEQPNDIKWERVKKKERARFPNVIIVPFVDLARELYNGRVKMGSYPAAQTICVALCTRTRTPEIRGNTLLFITRSIRHEWIPLKVQTMEKFLGNYASNKSHFVDIISLACIISIFISFCLTLAYPFRLRFVTFLRSILNWACVMSCVACISFSMPREMFHACPSSRAFYTLLSKPLNLFFLFFFIPFPSIEHTWP